MDAITTLLSEYSGGEIILIVVLLAVSIKFISDLYDWASAKVKAKYDEDAADDNRYEDIVKEIQTINSTIAGLAREMSDFNKAFREDLDDVKKNLFSINERLLENIRGDIIDKHHRYVRSGEISDFALQSLERQYNYYKSAGGNSFVDRLMEDVRELPIKSSEVTDDVSTA